MSVWLDTPGAADYYPGFKCQEYSMVYTGWIQHTVSLKVRVTLKEAILGQFMCVLMSDFFLIHHWWELMNEWSNDLFKTW